MSSYSYIVSLKLYFEKRITLRLVDFLSFLIQKTKKKHKFLDTNLKVGLVT